MVKYDLVINSGRPPVVHGPRGPHVHADEITIPHVTVKICIGNKKLTNFKCHMELKSLSQGWHYMYSIVPWIIVSYGSLN